jgi:hypothetical protein
MMVGAKANCGTFISTSPSPADGPTALDVYAQLHTLKAAIESNGKLINELYNRLYPIMIQESSETSCNLRPNPKTEIGNDLWDLSEQINCTNRVIHDIFNRIQI